MNITLLGTSGAEGWPGLFCRCDVCQTARAKGGKNLRTRSSALLDGVLKIDFPPDILQQVVNAHVDLLGLRAILFTHAHDDHLCASELQYAGPYFVPTPLTTRLPLYGPIDAICKINGMLEVERLPFALHVLQPYETVEIADYNVTPILAHHDPKQVCFNYIISDTSGATLLYATDTGWYDESTWHILEQHRFDAIVIECGNGPKTGSYPGHLSISDLKALRERLLESKSITAPCPVVATHFPHLGGMLHDELEATLGEFGATAGYDGMELAIKLTS